MREEGKRQPGVHHSPAGLVAAAHEDAANHHQETASDVARHALNGDTLRGQAGVDPDQLHAHHHDEQGDTLEDGNRAAHTRQRATENAGFDGYRGSSGERGRDEMPQHSETVDGAGGRALRTSRPMK